MIRAKQTILFKGRQYKKGDALPGDSPLVSIWLENDVAYDDTVKEEKPEEEKPEEEKPKKKKK